MIRITEEDKWSPFNGMQPFELFTHILTLVTCPPRLSLYLTKNHPTISDICEMANLGDT